MKTAIVNIADTGALESTVYMLESVGYTCFRPDPTLIYQLRSADLEGVYSVEELVDGWGYEWPTVTMLAGPQFMHEADLFVDLKAHVNYPSIVTSWPNLTNKVLWRCINGGDPYKRKDGHPWATPPCPVLTDNQWYEGLPRAYTHFPPYQRLTQRKRTGVQGPPICLVHNVLRWGHGNLVNPLQGTLGVKFYGGNSPDGLLTHSMAMELLGSALCMVHVKTGDTVGYSTVEALTGHCPLIVSNFYIEECKLQELLQPEVTCLTFNHLTDSIATIANHLERCKDEVFNREFSVNGSQRYLELQWKHAQGSDRNHLGQSFAEFMQRYFK